MYRLDWLEQLKLKSARVPERMQVAGVHPAVWHLGFTSMLTDVSAEMVTSVLPAFLVLYLHVSPLAYGTVDGLYHGMAVALLSIAGSIVADRKRNYREVAAAGYGLSALCKLALAAAGPAWGWVATITAIDRVGKGARVAPRDSLISLHSKRELLATSFAVHRSLDACGSLLGPLAAFLILSRLPNGYNAVWLTSFVFALLGLAILLLFVRNPEREIGGGAVHSFREMLALRDNLPFRGILAGSAILGALTVSDGFVYLSLQRASGLAPTYFPLLFSATSCGYMLFSLPAGMLADRFGMVRVLLTGYAVLIAVYLVLAFAGPLPGLIILIPALMGLYYAGTEGILRALTSRAVPEHLRASGLAALTTMLGFGKLFSALLFGYLWQTYHERTAMAVFAIALACLLPFVWLLLGPRNDHPRSA